jgi:Maltokinase N-terminal cap domain
MALIHQATLRPSKQELVAAWLPARKWYTGPTGEVERVATFRFDDPAGEVGIETMLIRVADGPVFQVPLTYRGAPLPGADAWLLDTSEHSVLGKRWIYDATADPVYAAALAGAILANTGQAPQYEEIDGRLQPRDLPMTITSTTSEPTPPPAVDVVHQVSDADPTRIVTNTVELAIVRRVTQDPGLTGTLLTATWPTQPTPLPLASAKT